MIERYTEGAMLLPMPMVYSENSPATAYRGRWSLNSTVESTLKNNPKRKP